MKDQIASESPNCGPETDKAVAETDLDFGGRSWRKRLASVREGPFRVVVLACLMFYCMLVCVAVISIVQEGSPFWES
jgi:hypothetical protein